MFNLKKVLLSMFLVASLSLTSLQASSQDHNLTDAQLHAFMGIITNFILSSPSQKEQAFEKIKTYASSDGNTSTPSINDYTQAQVTGVDSRTITPLNETIALLDTTEVDTTVKLQQIVNTILSTPPVLTLVGDANLTQEVNTPYTELGATAIDTLDGNLTSSIVIVGSVDIQTLGTQTLTYSVTDTDNNTATVERNITVVDTTPPVITLVGDNPQTIEQGSPYTELGATATDNYDTNLTGNIVINTTETNVNVVGTYNVYYDVNDTSGNEALQVTRTVHLVDTTPPTFTSEDNSTVAENQTSAITLVATDASAITYSLSGGDSADFDVNATTGVVTFKVAPDFETKDVYTFTATAIDAYGNESTQEVTIEIIDVDEGIVHNGTTYGTVTSPYTGKVWLDRNLGANRVCTSFDDTECYGDYYQWGRNFDGHQESNSTTTTAQATDVNATGSSFITGSSDWASVDGAGTTRTANWSATDGSSVCPVGFRVPTLTELKAETLDSGVTNSATAFSNFLKLPVAGYRLSSGSGSLGLRGSWGLVWASSVHGSYAHYVYFGSDFARAGGDYRASGFAVRCLRD